MRILDIDQDNFEATGLFFRMTDLYGMHGSPELIFERVKIIGQWIDGPVLANMQGHWNTDSIAFGLDPVPNQHYSNYRGVKALMHEVLSANDGRYAEIPPVVLSRDQAPCNEITLEGDAIDLTQFAFLQTNPNDDGRYIDTASVFTADPEMGANYDTYRCALRGPRKLGFNPEPGQTGYKMIQAAMDRGEKTARCFVRGLS